MVYVAIIRNYWGRGSTRDAALANIRKAGGRVNKRTPLVVYLTDDDDAGVDPISGGLQIERGKLWEMLERVNMPARKPDSGLACNACLCGEHRSL